MELISTRVAEDRVEATLADDAGLIRLEGSSAEIVALCEAMDQAAVLAGASPRPAWLAEVSVGEDVVRVGVGGGRVRLVTGPARG